MLSPGDWYYDIKRVYLCMTIVNSPIRCQNGEWTKAPIRNKALSEINTSKKRIIISVQFRSFLEDYSGATPPSISHKNMMHAGKSY